jgi:amino acid transporter
MDPIVTASAPAGSYKQELDRALNPLGNISMTLATSGLTVTVVAFAPVAIAFTGTMAFWVFLLAAVFCVCEGLSYAELGTAYPIAGGEYSLVARVLGRPVGAVLFAIMIANYVFAISAASLGGGLYLGNLWPWAGAHPQLIGVAIIAFAACVAALRIALGWIITAIFLVIELVAIPVVVVLGLVHAHSPADRLFTVHVYGSSGPINLTATAVILGATIAFFCYQGFGNSVIFSEETHHAKQKVGRMVMWALLISVVAICVPVLAAILGAPSVEGLLTAPSPFTYVVQTLGGHTVNQIVSLFVFFAIIDAVIAEIMAFGRVLWSSGRDRAWPTPVSRFLATVHPRLKTPYVATTVMAVVCAILTATSTLATTVTFLGIVTLGFAGLMGLSAFVLRFKKDAPADRYRLPLWPLPPLVLVAACVVMGTQQTLKDLLIVVSIGAAFLIYYLVYLRPRSDTHWVMLSAIEDDK